MINCSKKSYKIFYSSKKYIASNTNCTYSLSKFQCNGAVVLTVDKTGIPDDRRDSYLPVYQLGKEVRGPLLGSYAINHKFLPNISTLLYSCVRKCSSSSC